MNSLSIYSPDLNVRPPRSPRCRLGGFAILPRLLDKCRATLAGTSGEYHYNCVLDQEFLSFTGIDADALRQIIATGLSDGDVLDWVTANAPCQRPSWEIEQWSEYQNRRAPELHTELHAYFVETAGKLSAARGDIRAWADLLDLDDYCSFGGKA